MTAQLLFEKKINKIIIIKKYIYVTQSISKF